MERSVMMPTSEDPYERALRLLYGCMDLISEEECSYMSVVLPRDKGSVSCTIMTRTTVLQPGSLSMNLKMGQEHFQPSIQMHTTM